MKPRPYQRSAVDALKAELKGTSSTLLVASVGAGKTFMQALFVKETIEEFPETRFVCAVHTRELVEQNAKAMLSAWPFAPIGINSAALGRRDTRSQVLFCSIQSVHSKAKDIGWTDCLVIDECFSGDTEILTSSGFHRFDSLPDGVEVAQYNPETKGVSFVRPLRRIDKDPDSEVYKLTSKNLGDWRITGGHQMLIKRERDGSSKTLKVQLRDMNFNSYTKMFAAGFGSGPEEQLTDDEKFWIAFQADGNLHSQDMKRGTCRAYFSFSKVRKIDEFLSLIARLGWDINEVSCGPGSSVNVKQRRRFSVGVPYIINKDVSSRFDLTSMSYIRGRKIIEYMNKWDGHVATDNIFLYTSTDKKAADFYQSVASISGYYTNMSIAEDHRSDKFNSCYRLFINVSRDDFGTQALKKSIDETFKGRVYCVEVPDGSIIVRKNGRVMVTGNCHLISPKSQTMYRRFINELSDINPDLRIVGMSGTPYRMDSGLLVEGEDPLFKSMAYEVNVADLIERGYLTKPVSKATATTFDVSKVHTRGGEYIQGELEAAVNKLEVTEAAVDEIIRYGKDRNSWIAFASGVDHAREIRDAMRRRGVSCEMVEGAMSSGDRRRIINDYKAGKIKCLTNVNVLSIGFDHPAIDLIALMRPTKSAALYVQQVGRGLRLHESKNDCLVLDFANVVRTLGPVDNVQVSRPGKGTGEAPIRLCSECGCINHAAARACIDCGFEFPESDKPRHSTTADTTPVLSTEQPWLEVTGRAYAYHPPKDPAKPATVKATFSVDGRKVNKWFCPGHTGFARRDSDYHWKLHGGSSPFPSNVDEFLDRAGELKATTEVQLSFKTNPKYPDIVGWKTGDATYETETPSPPKGNLSFKARPKPASAEKERLAAMALELIDSIPF